MGQIAYLVLIVTFAGCSGSQSNQRLVGSDYKSQTMPSQQTSDTTSSTDPTCCDPYATDALKKAWQQFTKDGHYKLAQKLQGSSAYAYSWGDLGYDSEAGQHHLATIVEDTSRTQDTRFGVVIFSAPSGDKGCSAPLK